MPELTCILDKRHGPVRPGEDFCEICCKVLEEAYEVLPVREKEGSQPAGPTMARELPLVSSKVLDLTPHRIIVTPGRKADYRDLCLCGHLRQNHCVTCGNCEAEAEGLRKTGFRCLCQGFEGKYD